MTQAMFQNTRRNPNKSGRSRSVYIKLVWLAKHGKSAGKQVTALKKMALGCLAIHKGET